MSDNIGSRGSAAIVIILALAAILLVGWVFLASNQLIGIKSAPQTSPANLSAAQVGMDLKPQLRFITISTPSSRTFSYYHVSFAVPWNENPTVITSADGEATQLKFGGGRFVTLLARSPYASIASSVVSKAQTQDDLGATNSLFGSKNLSSDFNWMRMILSTTRDSALAASSTNTAEATLLAMKGVTLKSLVSDPEAIYSFNEPYDGFDIVGHIEDGGTAITQSHILIYDLAGTPHDLIVGSGTQSDVDSIISSIRFD